MPAPLHLLLLLAACATPEPASPPAAPTVDVPVVDTPECTGDEVLPPLVTLGPWPVARKTLSATLHGLDSSAEARTTLYGHGPLPSQIRSHALGHRCQTTLVLDPDLTFKRFERTNCPLAMGQALQASLQMWTWHPTDDLPARFAGPFEVTLSVSWDERGVHLPTTDRRRREVVRPEGMTLAGVPKAKCPVWIEVNRAGRVTASFPRLVPRSGTPTGWRPGRHLPRRHRRRPARPTGARRTGGVLPRRVAARHPARGRREPVDPPERRRRPRDLDAGPLRALSAYRNHAEAVPCAWFCQSPTVDGSQL